MTKKNNLEFIKRLNLLGQKIDDQVLRQLILHEVGHLFWMKDFNISKNFRINLIDLYDTISKFSFEEQNLSERNALLYEISLCNYLEISPFLEDIPKHIMMNYKGKSEWHPSDVVTRSYMLYDEICCLSKSLSLDTEKEFFTFADDTITKWLS